MLTLDELKKHPLGKLAIDAEEFGRIEIPEGMEALRWLHLLSLNVAIQVVGLSVASDDVAPEISQVSLGLERNKLQHDANMLREAARQIERTLIING